jgi:hypothetical protein
LATNKHVISVMYYINLPSHNLKVVGSNPTPATKKTYINQPFNEVKKYLIAVGNFEHT